MGIPLTTKTIERICGYRAYQQGEAYYRHGKVRLLSSSHDTDHFTAIVQGNKEYQVSVQLLDLGEVLTECSCLASLAYHQCCKHVAAVMMMIRDLQLKTGSQQLASHHGTAGMGSVNRSKSVLDSGLLTRREDGLSQGLIGLFDDGPSRISLGSSMFIPDTRVPLLVQFTCKIFSYGSGKYLFGVQLRIGPKRLYVVSNIREFLTHLERKEPYTFSRHFSYVPEQHFFLPEDEVVISQLLQIYKNERMYEETGSIYQTYARYKSAERILLIPPLAWENLQPLLIGNANAYFTEDDVNVHRFELTAERLPLQFAFDQCQEGGYRLHVEGLEQLIVLDSYGLVLCNGRLYTLPQDHGHRLAELRRMLRASHTDEIRIPSEQMEPFMERVVPGLMKLGMVRISEAVSSKLVHAQLKARLYLDRVRDRLLASLEFQYGDIVINPLEPEGQRRGEDRIIMRESAKERAILALMESAEFAKTESGYFMDGDEQEYHFLYHIIPQLEQLLEVYATSAVKLRIFTDHPPPVMNINVDDRTDWLEFKFEIDGIPEAEIRGIVQSLEEKRKFHRLPNGSLMPLEGNEFQEIITLINEMGIAKSDWVGDKARLPAVRGIQLMHREQSEGRIVLGKTLRHLLDHMRNPDDLEFPVPEPLEQVLRDYQKYGYQWMKTLAHYRFGGILGDDMGLGKTVQSIAFILSVLPEIREMDRPALIVAPASLIYNWKNELLKFAPDIAAVIADGSRSTRGKLMRNAAGVDVIITSYPLLRKDMELYEGRSFHTLVLDEAQAFKNHSTQTAQAVRKIQARYRFALTGTPVENSLSELWSIFEVILPGLFPDQKEFLSLSRDTVARRIRPFLLRRLKGDVLRELPEKIESIYPTELLPEQKKLYLAYLAKLRQETLKHLDDDDFNRNRIKILAGLTRLRQLCCHPALFVEGYKGSSAKFERLLEVIQECRSAGRRMLIFSQFTQMLHIISRELGYQQIPFFYLDGQTSPEERVELCRRFNAGEKEVFLISLKAGGTGLNLTGADTVILYDLWWNPAVEQQAADRAHRIGQKKVVQIIRLVTQGTIEDKMIELQQKKMNLIEEVIHAGEQSWSSLTEDDIRAILAI